MVQPLKTVLLKVNMHLILTGILILNIYQEKWKYMSEKPSKKSRHRVVFLKMCIHVHAWNLFRYIQKID